jgi:hypothetical protein
MESKSRQLHTPGSSSLLLYGPLRHLISTELLGVGNTVYSIYYRQVMPTCRLYFRGVARRASRNTTTAHNLTIYKSPRRLGLCCPSDVIIMASLVNITGQIELMSRDHITYIYILY